MPGETLVSTPAPDPAPLSSTTVSPGPLTLTVSHRSTRFSLHCPSDSDGTCHGTARLTSHGHTLGRASLRIARGKSKTVRMSVRRSSATRGTLRLTVNGLLTNVPVRIQH